MGKEGTERLSNLLTVRELTQRRSRDSRTWALWFQKLCISVLRSVPLCVCVNAPPKQLPSQRTTHSVASNNRNVFSRCSRGQKSDIEVSIGPCSLCRLLGSPSFLASSWLWLLLATLGIPWLSAASSSLCLGLHVPSSHVSEFAWLSS